MRLLQFYEYCVLLTPLPFIESFLQTSTVKNLAFKRVSIISQRNRHHKLILNDDVVTEQDTDDIYNQLGYVPTNLVSVAARRGGGINTPLVLKTYPLNGGAKRRKAKAQGDLTPFPTLYWFCCNEVGKAISELERRGFVGELEKRLCNDPEMFDKFIRSHDGYAEERWNSLSFDHQQYILKHDGMVKIIKYSGIAGSDYELFRTSKRPSIKCLHSHYAHYRGQMGKHSLQGNEIEDSEGGNIIDNINIVGLWVDELLTQEFPDLIL
jgi:hypothetical protein